jgi:hypothetical protein
MNAWKQHHSSERNSQLLLGSRRLELNRRMPDPGEGELFEIVRFPERQVDLRKAIF